MPERTERSWRDLAVLVPTRNLKRDIADFDLPHQLLDFARRNGLTTVGETLSHPDLRGGGRTFNVALKALKAPARPPVDLSKAPSLARALRARLKVLTKEEREIIGARAGLDGQVETLEALGSRFGGSRERMRRQEEAAMQLVGRDGFRAAIAQRLLQPMRRGGIGLHDPRARWLTDHGGPHVVRFAIAHFVDPAEQPHVVEVSGALFLLPLSAQGFDAVWRQARARLAELTYPARKSAVVSALTLGSQPAGITEALLHCSSEVLVWDVAGRVALTFGTGREEQVLAALRASPKPLTMKHIIKHAGTRRLPLEAMYLGPGLVGIKKHFPNFDAHYAALVPTAVDHMRSAEGRQWHTRDLMVSVRELHPRLPRWLTHWHLACLMQRSETVRYIGRNTFVLAASPATKRRLYADLMTDILKSTGEPMTPLELMDAVSEHRSVARAGIYGTLSQGPFTKLADGRRTQRKGK